MAKGCRSEKDCGKGKICRKAYTRKDKIKVKGKCIKNQGKPGKGPKLFEVKDAGMLGQFGYALMKKKELRQRALNKAVKKYGRLKVKRHLVAIRTLSKSRPHNYNKLNADVVYVTKKFFKK